MLIDSHVHLQDKKFARDLDRVIQRAEDAGIESMVVIGDRIEDSRKGVALARRYSPRLTAAVGVHPHHFKLFGPTTMLEMEALARDPAVVAIGEIGLDHHYPNFDPDKQIDAFCAQAHLAQRHGLPIVMHCRDAYDELLETIRNDPKIPRHGVIHCFSGTYEQAVAFMDLGYYLGLGGAVTYPNGDPLRSVVRRIGLERVLSETDAPYLPPQAKRGRRNEPSYMKHTIKYLADLTGVSYQDAARVTKNNAIRLFQLPNQAIHPNIVYAIRKTLYLCITNQCSNACYYCERADDYMVMGHFLKLDEEPTAEQLLSRVEEPEQYHEVVLSGLGEPTIRWDVCVQIARKLKEMGVRVRLNTNGQGNLINGRSIIGEIAGYIDSVNINMVAHDKATYNRVACPTDSDNGWQAMLDFARQCKQAVPDVTLSVVAVPEVDVEACRRLAEDQLQVRFSVREARPLMSKAG